jgi:hypothetical protein
MVSQRISKGGSRKGGSRAAPTRKIGGIKCLDI